LDHARPVVRQGHKPSKNIARAPPANQ
jgi:hypothetical protein